MNTEGAEETEGHGEKSIWGSGKANAKQSFRNMYYVITIENSLFK
jgi:hypothetical protein